jgi:hypothetical protein
MDENGIQQFASTVVENMLTDVSGRAAYINYNLNTNSSYHNYIMADGTYWRVIKAVHDVGPKIVPLKSLSAKFMNDEILVIMKEFFDEERMLVPP